ncbi:MAG: glycine cleavage system aminomethyltransferase GcvT [Planctomycetes bacterium]|nr:glycine cleavage system aminomethyltransferase GcvT [Planctomycetota bacterium]
MALRTALYDWHVAHGGRMVDFAGWDMPVQYSTIIDEHSAVRTGAGLFDISHMGRLSFGGPDALALIQKVYTNDAAVMKEGQVRYGLICNERGGIRDDVLVYRCGWSGHRWLMVVNASNLAKIVDWIADSNGALNAPVYDQTIMTCMIAVQGPRAIELVAGLTEDDASKLAYYYSLPTRCFGQDCVISRTGYTGEDGVELIIDNTHGVKVWEELIRRGAKPCGLGARDTLRLEAAMPLYGHELSEEIDPFQAGLAWAVKLGKGDFRGKEALLRRQDDATLHRRVGLELKGKRIAREGALIKSAGRTVGVVSSGTHSPTFARPIAMGYVDPAFQMVGSSLAVDIRGNDEDAVVVAMPFYKRSRS